MTIALKAGTKVELEVEEKKYYNQYLEEWQVQLVYDKPDYGRFYSASYTNEEKHQLVLAYRGTITLKEDLFAKDFPWKNNFEGIVGRGIVSQQIAAYVVTKEVAQYAKPWI